VVASYPLVALDSHDAALILHRKVLTNRPRSVAEEGVGEVKRLSREKVAEEVVECAFEDVRRANVGRQGLIVAGCWSMEGLDCSAGVDSVRAGVLQDE
jgi:hypothetical protein